MMFNIFRSLGCVFVVVCFSDMYGKQGKVSCWDWKKYDGSPLLFQGDSKVGGIEG